MSCSFNSFNSFDYPIITAQTYEAQRKIKLLIHNVCSSNWASLFSTSLPFACAQSLQAPLCLLFITHVTGCCDVQSPTKVGNGRTCVSFNAHYPLSLHPPLHPSSWASLLHILMGLLRYVFNERTGGTLSELFHRVLWVHPFVRMISCCVSILHFLYATIKVPRLVSALAAMNSVSVNTAYSKCILFLLVIYPEVSQLFHMVELLGLGETLALISIISLGFLCVKLSTPQ